jgi:Fe-S-cluster containining protein
MPERNPCLSCGACCALFKVAFDQTETDEEEGGIVPVRYTIKIDQTRCAMRGTERSNKRCMALEGVVGKQVICTIYGHRPKCCHNFIASWEKDIVNPICDRARITFGLQPFDAF